ncbi:MAG: hypothetical protein ACLPSH_03750 [Vulcanimicrobiaceae bacterium]
MSRDTDANTIRKLREDSAAAYADEQFARMVRQTCEAEREWRDEAKRDRFYDAEHGLVEVTE